MGPVQILHTPTGIFSVCQMGAPGRRIARNMAERVFDKTQKGP
jgi:hypothetical protein